MDNAEPVVPAEAPVVKESTTANITPAERESITKIIHSFAGKYVEKFPFLVFDDLVQEGWRVFYTYTDSHYDKTKGTSITTWFYKGLNWELISYAEREYKKTQRWDMLEDHHLEDCVIEPCNDFDYQDTVAAIKRYTSPLCNMLLDITLREPKTSVIELCQALSVTEKDLQLIRQELRAISKWLL